MAQRPSRPPSTPPWNSIRSEFGLERTRGYGQQSQSGSPQIVDPFGGLAKPRGWSFARSFADPLSSYFGVKPEFNDTKKGQRKEAHWQERYDAIANGDSPLATFARGAGEALPGYVDQARGVGERIASMAPDVYEQLRAQISSSLGALPGLQNSAADLTQRARGGADAAEGALGAATGAREAAFDPVADQALFQNALRQTLDSVRGASSARGLLDAGSTNAIEGEATRDLAGDYAQRGFQNQQAALFGEQNALGGLNNALGTYGSGISAESGLLNQGVNLAGAQGEGLAQLMSMLQAGYELPMDATQKVFGQFAAFQNPLMALLGMTAPQVGQRTSGSGFNIL